MEFRLNIRKLFWNFGTFFSDLRLNFFHLMFLQIPQVLLGKSVFKLQLLLVTKNLSIFTEDVAKKKSFNIIFVWWENPFIEPLRTQSVSSYS